MAHSKETRTTARTLNSLNLTQKQALYSAVYEGGSDALSTLGGTRCVALENYKLKVSDLGRKVAAAYKAAAETAEKASKSRALMFGDDDEGFPCASELSRWAD